MSEQSQSRQSDSVLCRYNLGTSQHTPEIDIHRGGLATASSASGAARGTCRHTIRIDLVRTFKHWDVFSIEKLQKRTRESKYSVSGLQPTTSTRRLVHASRDPNPVLCA